MSEYNKVSNTDIRQALNILCVATVKQLREVERFLEKELELFDGEEGKKLTRRNLDLIAYVGLLTAYEGE